MSASMATPADVPEPRGRRGACRGWPGTVAAGWPGRIVRACVGAGAALLVAGILGAQGAASSGGAPRRTSIADSPGYVPAVDPESLSVVIGRRLNAPLVGRRFAGGAHSLDDLGRAVCRALHRGDADSLLALCVREDEFRDILWREFPQSRPATGLTWQDGWMALFARLNGGCRGAIGDFGGRPYEFLRFERSETTACYRNFKLHNGLILVARIEGGDIERFAWLRSVAERKGAFKIYSVRD